MDTTRQQIVDSIKANSNVLVTVSDSPSVDELSAALGLTILLNNLDKRATAVFSGAIPPAISFLEPDKTFENTADSLRDFIIALDKEKADHLRYKVDGDVVKIFITPYRTTLSRDDLEFSQGDYNVELVIAIGVKDQDHLDKALAAHGKILHDATVVTVTAGNDKSSLGTIDWHDGAASSLSEMVVSLADGLKGDKPLLDEQISTAFLTGIVSATDRFSNDRTTSRVMTMAAQLMAAGANQQLIAAKLEEAHDIEPRSGSANAASDTTTTEATKTDASELSIARSDRKAKSDETVEQSDVESTTEDTTNAELEAKQQELEAELAAVTAPAPPTLGDIEKELQESAEPPVQEVTIPQSEPLPEPPVPDPALTTPTDTAMPGFEPTGSADPVVAADQQAILPPLPPLPPESAPPIINDHGSFTDVPPSTGQPINSINAGPSADDLSVDPFAAASVTTPTETPLVITPPANDLAQSAAPVIDQSASGTPEGAAQLGAVPPLEPITLPDPVQQPVATPEVPTLPPLPPLPPLPTDGSLPPLPPPPPLPDFGQLTATPSGAVSGDVFGDSAPAPQQAAPAEPGQFKIPGQ